MRVVDSVSRDPKAPIVCADSAKNVKDKAVADPSIATSGTKKDAKKGKGKAAADSGAGKLEAGSIVEVPIPDG